MPKFDATNLFSSNDSYFIRIIGLHIVTWFEVFPFNTNNLRNGKLRGQQLRGKRVRNSVALLHSL